MSKIISDLVYVTEIIGSIDSIAEFKTAANGNQYAQFKILIPSKSKSSVLSTVRIFGQAVELVKSRRFNKGVKISLAQPSLQFYSDTEQKDSNGNSYQAWSIASRYISFISTNGKDN